MFSLWKGKFVMGKTSSYPDYSQGSLVINGKELASVTEDDNKITSSYNMSDYDKKTYNKIQKSLNKAVKNLYNFSSNKKLWNQQLNAYKKQGIKEIDSIYTPMETSLKNDIANRFGNLDNSVFLDKLSKITDNKAQAVSSLSDSLLMKRDQLYANELQNRMNYISLLSGLSTNYDNRALAYLNIAKSNAESGNNYNTKTYQQNSGGSFLSNALTGLGAATTAINPAIGYGVTAAGQLSSLFI